METRYIIKENKDGTRSLVKVTSRLVEDEEELFTGPGDVCDYKKRVLSGQKRCFKKATDGTIVEIDPVTDGNGGLNIANKEGLFLTKVTSEIHRSTGWSHYFYYDENDIAHQDNMIHKILATSNQEKYPEVEKLTVNDLLQEQDNFVKV